MPDINQFIFTNLLRKESQYLNYFCRWLYLCRLPLLPEKELLANDLEIFDKRQLPLSTNSYFLLPVTLCMLYFINHSHILVISGHVYSFPVIYVKKSTHNRLHSHIFHFIFEKIADKVIFFPQHIHQKIADGVCLSFKLLTFLARWARP